MVNKLKRYNKKTLIITNTGKNGKKKIVHITYHPKQILG